MKDAKFFINGKNVNVLTGWKVNDKISQDSTLNFSVYEDVNNKIGGVPVLHIRDALLVLTAEVSIWDSIDYSYLTNFNYNDPEFTKVFGGFVQGGKRMNEKPTNLIRYNAFCMDNTFLSDKRIIADIVENLTVEELIDNYFMPLLSQEGVSKGLIVGGEAIIERFVMNDLSISDALEKVCKSLGYVWNINHNKELVMNPKEENNAPFEILSNSQVIKFNHNKKSNKYRNVQILKAGKARTGTQLNEKPTPKPDGVTRTFLTRFPLAEIPVITTVINGVTRVVPPELIGVNGKDQDKEWYWNYNVRGVTQDKSLAELGNADEIDISYFGLVNIKTINENINEIEKEKDLINGTSGKIEKVIENIELTTDSQAISYSDELLSIYSKSEDIVSFRTYSSGLEAGQILKINLPLFEISEDFLIETVSLSRDADTNKLIYDIKAIDGQNLGGWKNYFKNLINLTRKVTLDEDSIVITPIIQREVNNYSGQWVIETYKSLYPSDDLYPSDALYPNTELYHSETLRD